MKKMRFYAAAKVVLAWLFKGILVPTRVYGAENMPKTGPVVLCCNHSSMADPIRLAYSQPRQIHFMAKEELFRVPVLNYFIRILGAFPVSRGKGDRKAVNTARKFLMEGNVLGIFPEGTRSKNGELLRPKSGAVLLASQTGAPIVPCCITPVNAAMPKIFHRCVISIGKPILPQEIGVAEGTPSEYRAASNLLMNRIAALRDEDLKRIRQMKGLS